MSAPARRRVLAGGDPPALFAPVLEAGGQVSLAVTGDSMEPFLREGRDTVWLSALTRPPRRGDILFFCRPCGTWVLHRVQRVTPQGCVVSGDAQTWREPVRSEQILAVVSAVERGGHMRAEDSRRARARNALWRGLRPVRPLLMKLWRHRPWAK